MTVNDFLSRATKKLAAAGIRSARLDCLVLLEDTLQRDRAHILAHPESEISPSTEVKLNKKITQRTTHAPLAYIRNKAPFYGREFTVNKHVLVPRPESETIIDTLKALPLPDGPRVADIGTGSGCLGITAALEIPRTGVHLYELDKQALAVARRNARSHGVPAEFYSGNLLERYSGPYDAVLANLPYVPDGYEINQAARHEPRLSLFGGKDGLDLYRQFWQQISELPEKPKYILTEALPAQHGALAQLAKPSGYRAVAANGLIQIYL